MERPIKEQLLELANEDYKTFTSALIPNVRNILGIRLPELRKLAKTIAKDDWRTYLAHAKNAYANEYFEEIMLQGMVIGSIKTEIEEILGYVAQFVPKIDNWSVCDSFCTSLKLTRTNKERIWVFLQPYLASDREYELRFGVVMLLNYYIDEEHISSVLQLLDRIKHEGYYVKMAVAWALSMCFVKFPEFTMAYLEDGNSLDQFTYNKALQKIVESNRVSQETKAHIRGMKRK